MFSEHPVLKVIELISKLNIPNNSIFHFSTYQYSYRRNIDLRKYLTVKSQDITIEWLKKTLDNLELEWNLSFHGNISFPNGQEYFLPLIDFNTRRIDDEILEIINFRLSKSKEILKYKNILQEMTIYSSGRSFHGYGNTLLEFSEWKSFTVAILLLNYTRLYNELDTIVDTRWVAHRLLSGYPFLRWSNNSDHYYQYPKLFKQNFLLQ